ncbi:MAG: class I SAM-dependent methyltransferase [Myxococcales bacterium]|nr:class I SAM-dependent methyltransferase [Myxococcales bacterium]
MGEALGALATARDRMSGALRRQRVALLESLLEPLPRPLRILDVGGTQAFWNRAGFAGARDLEIVLLNRERVAVSGPPFSSVVGDGCRMPEFADGAFDVAFSNSVIEHAGDREEQRRMAGEIRRVGRRYFVQTPNRHFPVEPHFVFPLFQFLPLALRVLLLRRFSLGWVPRMPDAAEARAFVRSIRLLTGRELAGLFPGATLHRERVCGLTKSFVATDGFDAPPPAAPYRKRG